MEYLYPGEDEGYEAVTSALQRGSSITVESPQWINRIRNPKPSDIEIVRFYGRDESDIRTVILGPQRDFELTPVIDLREIHSSKPIYQDLVNDLNESGETERITHLSEEIFDLYSECSESDKSELLVKLREIFSGTTNQYKQASLLQLLAELGDNDSVPIFINEIRRYAENTDNVAPSLPLVAIVTFVRLLKIPPEQRNALANLIKISVKKSINLEFEEKTAFVTGALVTLRAIGSLADIDFLVEFLHSEDPGIAEICIDSLAHIWRRAVTNKEIDLDDYRNEIVEELRRLIQVYGSNIPNEDDITPVDLLLSRTSLFLIQVASEASVDLLSNLFITALKSENIFLMTSLFNSFKAFSTEMQDQIYNSIANKLNELHAATNIFVTMMNFLGKY